MRSADRDDGDTRPTRRAASRRAVPPAGADRRRDALRRLLASSEARRRRQEGKGRSIRALLDQFFANVPAAVAMFDTSMRYVFASNRWLQDFHLEGQDLIGRSHYDVFPDVPARWREIHRRSLAGEIIRAREDRFERADGTVEWLRWEVRPWRNDRGEIGGILIFSESITAQKRLEEDLRREHEELRSILDAVPALVMYMDLEDRVLWVNRAYVESSGKSIEQIIGRSLVELVPRADVKSILESNHEVIATGQPKLAVEGEIETWRGTRWVETSKLPYREESGRIVGIVAVIEDVTERKEARERIERALADASGRAAELQAVLDNMVDGVFVCDAAGRPTLANDAALRLLGLSNLPDKEQILQLPVALRLRSLDGRPVTIDEMPLMRALRGQVLVGENYVIHNAPLDRDIYLRTNASPIRDADDRIVGAVAVSYDVTRLFELDRMKDEFIGVAAHELKTPVAIMKGYAQLLLQSGASLGGPQRRMLDAIDRGANRIDRIVRDLLDVSRLRLGRLALAPERYDLAGQLAEVTQSFALAEPDHPVTSEPVETAVVFADRDRIGHVLLNLLTNAARYSPAGAEIRTEVRTRGGEAIVSVADYGIGIPRRKQELIFEQFYRAHTGTPFDRGGMGIGLHFSREIVERHGGRMWFESEEGKGSTFHFSLPLAPPEVASAPKASPEPVG